MNIAAQLDRVKIDAEDDYTGHLMVSLQAPESETKRTPISLALVLDRSGSMSGRTDSNQSKMDAVKDVAAKIVRNLTEDDELTLIAFSSGVETLIERQKVTNKDELVAKISGLTTLDNTNLCGGTAAGCGALVESSLKGVRRVLVLTDGLPTGGGSKAQILEYLTSAMAQKRDHPVTLSTFGFGLDADQELLASMAKLGSGNYTYVKGGSDIGNLFARELGGLVSCMAQNIRVRIKPGKGTEVLEVLNDLKVSESDDNGVKVADVDAEDIYAGETKHVLVKVKIAKPQAKPKDRAFSICHVDVTYDDLKNGKRENTSHNVKVEFVKADEADKDAALAVAEQVALQEAARKQIEAVQLANTGNYVGAQSVLRSMDVKLKGLCARGSDLADEVKTSLSLSADGFAADKYDQNYGNAVAGTARSATRYRGGAGGQCVGALNAGRENLSMKHMVASFQEPGAVPVVAPLGTPTPAVVVPPPPKSLAKSKRLPR